MVSHRAREMASLTELTAENLMNEVQLISQQKGKICIRRLRLDSYLEQ